MASLPAPVGTTAVPTRKARPFISRPFDLVYYPTHLDTAYLADTTWLTNDDFQVGDFYGITNVNTAVDKPIVFRFAGDFVGIQYRSGSNLGIIGIYIDGIYQGQIDCYSDQGTAKDNMAWFENLGTDYHELRLMTTNAKNGASTAKDIFVTGLIVDAKRNPPWIPIQNAISRALGDPQRSPDNVTGKTLTSRIARIQARQNESGIKPNPGASETTTALGANAVYTGSFVDCSDWYISIVRALAFADQPSATSGFVIQESPDGTNADNNVASGTTVASTGLTIGGVLSTLQARIKYTNGATAQLTFRLSRRMNTAA